ncbi:MAG: response regulator transcription factor [Anaerolineales bacterium]|nr:response regulator transcription factor [Anaerolineales bacterium]
MEAQAKVRIVLADDHPVVREGLAALINRRPDLEVVAEAADGQAAVQAYAEHRPDLILIDLRMPIMGGVEAIQQIRATDPEARAIILTTYEGDEDIYRGLAAGAMAYLLKDTPRQELLDTIRAVAAGHKRIAPDIAARLTDRLLSPTLTPREIDVLRLVASGLSNRNIGETLTISEGTVKTHINSLLGKLGVADRTQAVTEALRRGIIHLD